MQTKIEKLSPFSDPGGVVFEPIESVEIPSQRNCHVVVSMPGAVRGNHYHLEGVETIVLMGPARIRYREDHRIEEVVLPAGEIYRIVFPPGVPHAIQNTAEHPATLVVFNTRAYDPENPDTRKFTLIEGG